MKLGLALVPVLALCGLTPVHAQQGPIPLLPATGHAQPQADSGHPQLTSESAEFCDKLRGQVGNLLRDTKGSADDKVRVLTVEGERLCDNGQTRSGILYLRRAYLLLSKSEPAR